MAGANPFARTARDTSVRTAEDFLDGGASVAAKWPTENFTVEGDLIGWSPTAIQMTDIKTGEPLYWEGKAKTKESDLRNPELSKQNPCLQITMDLQCEPTGVTWKTNRYIKEEVPDDDGVRTMYVNGQLAAAIKKGRQEAAQKYKLGKRLAPLEEGVHVKVTRGRDKKMPNDYFGFTFTAEWTPAAHNPAYQNAQLDATEGPADDSPWDTGSSQAESDEPPF
jgi:hypothetical protein